MGSEKVEEDTEAAIFYSKNLPFLYDFYVKRFVSFVSLSTCLFSLFICFSIFLFRSSPFFFLLILFSLFLCFFNFHFRSSSFLFIFHFTPIFVLVPFLFISLHVNCFFMNRYCM
ncbi:hypothetical protein AAZX31_19G041900 [Glycine max]